MPLNSTYVAVSNEVEKPTIRSLRKTGTESLYSTWRTKIGGRVGYEGRAAHHLELKVLGGGIGPELLPYLQASDTEGTGHVHYQELQRVLLVHFNIVLGWAELDCLKAEWRVLDPVTQLVDYNVLCAICTHQPEQQAGEQAGEQAGGNIDSSGAAPA